MGSTSLFQFLISLTLIAQHVLAVAVYPASSSVAVPALQRRDPLPESTFQKFKWGPSCDDNKQTNIKKAFSNIRDMIDALSDSLLKVEKQLTSEDPPSTPVDDSSWPVQVKSQLKMLKCFYGDFDHKDECGIEDGVNRMETVDGVLETMKPFFDKEGGAALYSPNIYCDDSHLEYVKNIGPDFKVFKNNLDPQNREVTIDTTHTLCDNDNDETLAAMSHPDGANDDWLIFCPRALEKFGNHHLSEYKNRPFLQTDGNVRDQHSMQGKVMDQVLNESPEATILHELGHSSQIFQNENSGKTHDLDDKQGPGDEPAYTFKGVKQLAEDNVDDPIEMARNAETLAYAASAAYLNQCDWSGDGICKDPAQVQL